MLKAQQQCRTERSQSTGLFYRFWRRLLSCVSLLVLNNKALSLSLSLLLLLRWWRRRCSSARPCNKSIAFEWLLKRATCEWEHGQDATSRYVSIQKKNDDESSWQDGALRVTDQQPACSGIEIARPALRLAEQKVDATPNFHSKRARSNFFSAAGMRPEFTRKFILAPAGMLPTLARRTSTFEACIQYIGNWAPPALGGWGRGGSSHQVL